MKKKLEIITVKDALEILYFDWYKWDGTKNPFPDAEYERWCDENWGDDERECENVMIPYSYRVFNPLEYEEGMSRKYKNGWVEMIVVCEDEVAVGGSGECIRNSGTLIDIPLPDNREDYDICLRILGENPDDFHNMGTRFLKRVNQ